MSKGFFTVYVRKADLFLETLFRQLSSVALREKGNKTIYESRTHVHI